MKISDLAGGIKSISYPPQTQIQMQRVVLSTNNCLTDFYGVQSIPKYLYLDLINRLLIMNKLPEIDFTSLSSMMETITSRHAGRDPIFRANESSVFLGSLDIIWDQYNPQIIYKLISELYPIRPDGLQIKLNELKKQLTNHESRSTKLVLTSSLEEKQEIYDAFKELMLNAEKRLFIMVAYYSDEMKFFSALLKEISNHNEIEIRMLIRDPEDASANDKLIRDLRNLFGDQDIVRIYSERNYLGEKLRIGNLHSKMIMSEKQLLIGSANVMNTSFAKNEESAILTNDTELVNSAYLHFNLIWNQFGRLK